MKKIVIILALIISLSSFAGFDEGLIAYQKDDYDTAYKEFLPLAEKGNGAAQFILGLMFEDGEGVLRDIKQAIYWFKKVAKQDDTNTQYNLGLMYEKGEQVLQDYQKAVSLYRAVAKPLFSLTLGNMYEIGDGVPQDYKKALENYKHAAHLNSVEAQYKLGNMYVNGLGVATDYKQARYWMQKAYNNPNISQETRKKVLKDWRVWELWKYGNDQR